MDAVSDRQRRDVDVDVIGNDRRIDANVHLVHRLLEDAARVANAVGRADEAQRDADGDLLAGDQLLEIDVEDLALERDGAGSRGSACRAVVPSTRELDDGAAAEICVEQLLDVARVERERLRLAAVAVDDRRDLAGLAKLARDARAALVRERSRSVMRLPLYEFQFDEHDLRSQLAPIRVYSREAASSLP